MPSRCAGEVYLACKIFGECYMMPSVYKTKAEFRNRSSERKVEKLTVYLYPFLNISHVYGKFNDTLM